MPDVENFRFFHICHGKTSEISPHVENFFISLQSSYMESWKFSTWKFFLHIYNRWYRWQIWGLSLFLVHYMFRPSGPDHMLNKTGRFWVTFSFFYPPESESQPQNKRLETKARRSFWQSISSQIFLKKIGPSNCWGNEAFFWGNEANLMGKWSKLIGKWSKMCWGDAQKVKWEYTEMIRVKKAPILVGFQPFFVIFSPISSLPHI